LTHKSGWRFPHEDKWTVETRTHNVIEVGTRQVKAADGYFVENAVRLHAGWSLAIALLEILLSYAAVVWRRASSHFAAV